MRIRLLSAALISLALAGMSCSERGIFEPTISAAPNLTIGTVSLPSVRIAEFHYDNTGTDAGEAIEISGPAGTDVTGWSVVLYNGNGGVTYGTRVLSGAFPATCDTRGVMVLSYPSNGIQNGGTSATGTTEPDGIALIDAAGAVVEFLSYEGSLTATNGPAIGLTSVDIGIRELGSEPADPVWSLKRDGAGVWSGPSLNSFGVCNDADEPPPPAEVAIVTIAPASATVFVGGTQAFAATAYDSDGQAIPGTAFTWSTSGQAVATVNASGLATGVAAGDVVVTATATNGVSDDAALHVEVLTLPSIRFSELHYDNFGTDANESLEIEGPAGTDLSGWSVVLYNGNGGGAYNTRALSGTIPDLCDGRGVVVLTYPQDGIQNGSPDGMALVDAGGQVVEFLSYEGTFIATTGAATGMGSIDIGVAQSSTPVGQSLQRNANGLWTGPTTATFGACNDSGEPPPPVSSITFSGRVPSDPPLPVGYEDQLFATLRDATGAVVPTTFVWLSETPAIASIDQNGVMRALAAGTATVRATAEDGTTAIYGLPTRVALASTTAQYGDHAEFGEPGDADASDDFIVRYTEYTASYNRNRGTPNWVAYNIDPTHFGPEDRCDCFTFDDALPGAFTRFNTADYTGAGAFHGYGIDRGHLARSFDRTSASLDNARTYLFTNIIPQAADNNQGPWAVLESYLGDFARLQNKELYVIAGVAGSKGTVKDEGKIVIPAQTWKVAVIMDRDEGLANIDDYLDLEVVAVVMPNDPGIRNVPWQTYETTVDAIEALSGYDLLALLPDHIEFLIESGTHPPDAVLDGPYSSLEGEVVSMSAVGSSDPDGHALTYAWSFGDGGTATGVSTSHTYAQDGSFTVRLIVTDELSVADTAFATATVSNVAPVIAAFSGATLLPLETYSASGSFTDPGADSWSATVDYGDGGGESALSLSGMTFALSHVYTSSGGFTVTVRVTDDDVTASRTQTVTVLTYAQAIQNAIALIDQLVADGALAAGNANSLKAKLDGAAKNLMAGDVSSALDKLQSARSELDGLIRSGRISSTDAAALRTLLSRLIASLSAS